MYKKYNSIKWKLCQNQTLTSKEIALHTNAKNRSLVPQISAKQVKFH